MVDVSDFDPTAHEIVAKRDLAVLRKGQDVMNKLWSHPKYGLETKQRVAELDPAMTAPELPIIAQVTKPVNDAIKTLSEKLDSVVTRLDTREKTEKDRAEENDLQSKLERAKKDYRLTDDGMKKVVEYMKEHNVADPLAAAARVTDLEPKAKPTRASSFGPSPANLFGSRTQDTQWEKLHTDPDGFFNDTVEQVLSEFSDAA
jgi:exonuclease VII large subunit